jgi:hypothetical protein
MTSLVLRDTAPSGWDTRAGFAYLFTGFAAASAELGYRTFYVEDAHDHALVLVRGVPIPRLAAGPAAQRSSPRDAIPTSCGG